MMHSQHCRLKTMLRKAQYINLIILLFLVSSCAESGKRQLSENDAQKESELKESMQRIQMGVEHYAADHGSDKYPTELNNEFKSYLPGGVEGSEPAAFGTINPFTGKNEFITVNTSLKDVHAARFGPRIALKPGEILYCPVNGGSGYLIVGGGIDGKAIPDDKNPGQLLVLSNIDED